MKVSEIIRLRPEDSYSSAEKHEVQLMSVYEDQAHPFGSNSYVIQKYPGDIDLLEDIIRNGMPKTVASDVAARFQAVVRKVWNKPCHFVTDVKAGADPRYSLSIGELNDGRYIPNMANISYFANNVSSADSERILELIGETPLTQNQYDQIEKIVREYNIIRWTASDVLRGYIVKNGKRFTLVEAIQEHAQTKLDVVTVVNGRFTEVTNILFIASMYQGKLHILNTSFDFTNTGMLLQQYDINLKEEIEKLAYSGIYYNPFKAAKRMWAFARTTIVNSIGGNESAERYILALTPVISGNISLLYQIKSEIASIELIYDKPCVVQYLPERLQAWRIAISHVIELQDSVMQSMFHMLDTGDIYELQKILKPIINNLTLIALKNSHLFPIPNFFLPGHRSYRRPLVA